MGTNRRYPSNKREAPNGLRRHCWVMRTAHERGPWPGLILEWRQLPSRDWQARVVYVPDPRHPTSVEGWFAAALLRPLDAQPPSQSSQAVAGYRAAGGDE